MKTELHPHASSILHRHLAVPTMVKRGRWYSDIPSLLTDPGGRLS